MKQGATTISTHPGTLPLIEVGDNDRGCVVRFGRVALRLTAEPGGTGNVRVVIFGEKEFGYAAPAVEWQEPTEEQRAEGTADLIIVAREIAPDAWRKEASR